MIEKICSEILAIIVKELAAQSPAIAAAIVKELSEVSETMYKYIVDAIHDDKIDTKHFDTWVLGVLMPLKSGKKNIGDNIKELASTGKYKPTQTIAIALDVARKSETKKKSK